MSGTYLDRDGTERDDSASDHNPLCAGDGWLLTGTEDRPRPCLDCRPHLRDRFAENSCISTERVSRSSMAKRTGAGITPVRSIRVPDDVWAAAKAAAERRGESLSEAVVQFLRRYGAQK